MDSMDILGQDIIPGTIIKEIAPLGNVTLIPGIHSSPLNCRPLNCRLLPLTITVDYRLVTNNRRLSTAARGP